MTCDNCGNSGVVRLQNRALRTMNRLLRRDVERLQRQADEAFAALCELGVGDDTFLDSSLLTEEGGLPDPEAT